MSKTDDRAQSRQPQTIDRRSVLTTGLTAGAAVAATATGLGAAAQAKTDPYAPPAKGALPPSDMKLDHVRTALVITDPRIDFLHPEGVAWGVDRIKQIPA